MGSKELAQLMLPDEAATHALGRRLAGALQGGDVIRLRGDLGAGKTTLVRACLRTMGITGRVRSPSFALMESYAWNALEICHFDFYRLDGAQQWRDAGFDERIGAPDTVCLIEWPDQAGTQLPERGLCIELTWPADADTYSRMVTLQGLDPRGHALLQAVLS